MPLAPSLSSWIAEDLGENTDIVVPEYVGTTIASWLYNEGQELANEPIQTWPDVFRSFESTYE